MNRFEVVNASLCHRNATAYAIWMKLGRSCDINNLAVFVSFGYDWFTDLYLAISESRLFHCLSSAARTLWNALPRPYALVVVNAIEFLFLVHRHHRLL